MIYEMLGLGFVAVSAPLLYRLAKGPTIADMVLATDALAVLFCNAMVMFSIAYQRSIYLDVAVVVAALSFIGTLAVARMVEAGKL